MINRIRFFIRLVILLFLLCVKTLSSGSVTRDSNMMTRSRCTEKERQALLLLKQGLVDTHGLLSSWGPEDDKRDCCQWRRVHCDSRTGHVTHLNLSYVNYYDSSSSGYAFKFLDRDIDGHGTEYIYSYGISTSIPFSKAMNISHSLLDLHNLIYLDLSFNYFGGMPIPKFIGSFTKLVHLDLSQAHFGGAIPDQIGNLSQLQNLNLGFNSFDSSPIPNFISSLTSLKYLDLASCNFEGAIPYQFADIAKLQYLDLSGNYLSEDVPYQLGNLSELRHLDISMNSFIGEIPHQLGNLFNLRHLDLYSTGPGSGDIDWLLRLSSLTYLDLSSVDIGTANDWVSLLVQSLPSLSVLRLNACNLMISSSSLTNSSPSISTLQLEGNLFDLSIFYWLSNLSSSLIDLDLSGNMLKGKVPESFDFTAITHLDLSWNELVVFPNLSRSLVELDLSNNRLKGRIPVSFALMNSMTRLHLTGNELEGVVPELSTRLIELDLSSNMLTGPIPNSFGLMTSMASLNLYDNKFNGVIPNSFSNLSSLQVIDLRFNSFKGDLQEFLYGMAEDTLQLLFLSANQFTGSPPDISRFSSLRAFLGHSNHLNGYLPTFHKHHLVLQVLDLSNNSLKGSLPDFTGFSSLKNLNLAYNEFSGSLPDFSGCSALEVLKLSENRFTEWKTQSIGQLPNLTELDLSKNLLRGAVSEVHLSSAPSLEMINTSFNPLIFNLSSTWLPPFQFHVLSLASCKLGPSFPSWIQNQKEIHVLDLSNSQITGTLPMWFWNLSTTMNVLDLSFNKLRGKIFLNYFHFVELDLSFNYFEGTIPRIISSNSKINLSRNKFSGTLVSFSVVEFMSLTFLDLSHNQLSGVLPDSWGFFIYLVFINVGHNMFWGRIPQSMGNLEYLETLILRDNRFSGELPMSLRNCSTLGFVDFGLNNLSGNMPAWLGEDLPLLYGIVLRSNRFSGSIPHQVCRLLHLHFLDLSTNRFTGPVPPCFGNLTAMVEKITEETSHYYDFSFTRDAALSSWYVDDALARWKGQEYAYGRNFAYLKMIDLSSNELTGNIPNEITGLVELTGLNLSRNKLSGNVPPDIGGLRMLESLDLSWNKISGEIPGSMSKLSFLAYLDLSNNNLTGRIPLATQLQGFNASAYGENVGLCGSPLNKTCPGDTAGGRIEASSEVDDDESEYEYISAAFGFSITFWGIFGVLLHRRWRHAYFLFLQNLGDRFYVAMAVRIARMRNVLASNC